MHVRSDDGGADRHAEPARRWTFVTNHLLVLQLIAEDPSIRMVDVARRLGLGERSVQMVIADLVADGYLSRSKVGRRNHYEIAQGMPLRHLETRHRQIGDMLDLLRASSPEDRPEG